VVKDKIIIRGAKEHNLKNINIEIPRDKFVVLTGLSGSGKSSLVANLILRADPPFVKLVVVHPDNESADYDEFFNGDDPDDESVVIRQDIPTLAEFNAYVKENEDENGEPQPICVVLDDIEYETMKKDQKKSLDHLMRYVSSHKNITVYVTSQYFFLLPIIIRRNTNVLFFTGSFLDKGEQAIVAKKIGLSPAELKSIFDLECKEFYDNICFDLTKGTPAPLRKNGFEVLDINNYKKKKLLQRKHVPR